MLTGELYTFIFVDIISHNFVLAGVVVFLVDLVRFIYLLFYVFSTSKAFIKLFNYTIFI